MLKRAITIFFKKNFKQFTKSRNNALKGNFVKLSRIFNNFSADKYRYLLISKHSKASILNSTTFPARKTFTGGEELKIQ